MAGRTAGHGRAASVMAGAGLGRCRAAAVGHRGGDAAGAAQHRQGREWQAGPLGLRHGVFAKCRDSGTRQRVSIFLNRKSTLPSA
jgi:hypothetical protein